MFTGNYLDNNIGHEIINLFADDFSRNFIYLCKDGKINRKDVDLANSYTIQVRRPKGVTGTLEVISIAKGLKLVDESKFRETHSILDIDAALNKDPLYLFPPTYGGESVYDIFQSNQQQQDCCVTFVADQVFIPNKPIYIRHDGEENDPNCMVVINKAHSQQMREYIFDDENKEDFETLSSIIPKELTDKDALWALRNPEDNKVANENVYVTATDIYGIQGRELSYSNAFKYFLDEYPELLGEFCRYKECELKLTESFTVYREWNNIDILINCGDWVFVIENKIFSGINGKREDGTNQLDKYKKIINKDKIKGENNPFYNKKHKFILLSPDHNKISVEKPWITIPYSEIYDFLKRNTEISPYKDDFHFVDFVKSLEQHSKSDYTKIVMHKKFVRAIKKAKPTSI